VCCCRGSCVRKLRRRCVLWPRRNRAERKTEMGGLNKNTEAGGPRSPLVVEDLDGVEESKASGASQQAEVAAPVDVTTALVKPQHELQQRRRPTSLVTAAVATAIFMMLCIAAAAATLASGAAGCFCFDPSMLSPSSPPPSSASDQGKCEDVI